MASKSLSTVRLLYLGAAVLSLSCTLVGCAKSDSADWPQWRGPNRDGISRESDWDPEALDGGAKILWTADVGMGFSNVAIKEDLLFTMGAFERSEHVLCLNAVTGIEIWRYSCENASFNGSQSTPTVEGNRVYALGTDGTLLCLKAKNGELLWTKRIAHEFNTSNPRYGFTASPVVEGKVLLLNANTKMIGLDKKTGELLWSLEDEVPVNSWGSYSTNVVAEIAGRRAGLFVGPSTFTAVEVKTGRELWSYEHGDRMHPTADPIVVDDRVFLSLAGSCVMLEMSGTGVREVWGSTDLNTIMSPPVIVDGQLYGTHFPVEVSVLSYNWSRMLQLDWPFRCVRWDRGEVIWEQSMKSVSLTAAGGMLVLLDLEGTLSIVEATPSSFKERSSADVFGGEEKRRVFATPPVLCGGKIYCRNHSGELVCIDVGK